MRLYMCACERCGKEVPATLAGYAKMVLGNSARIDGKARALCPECALALTKLDECELWLGRCELRATASPTLKGAAQDAAMPCLKAEEAHGFAMPDVNVEVKAEVTAEELAKSLREAMKPAMRMAVE